VVTRTNLLWSNEIYTCAGCGGSNESPFDKTEAFVFKREVPGFGFGLVERFAHVVRLEELHRIWNNLNYLPEWQISLENNIVSRRAHFLTTSIW
jgi:hypothetical protein